MCQGVIFQELPLCDVKAWKLKPLESVSSKVLMNSGPRWAMQAIQRLCKKKCKMCIVVCTKANVYSCVLVAYLPKLGANIKIMEKIFSRYKKHLAVGRESNLQGHFETL